MAIAATFFAASRTRSRAWSTALSVTDIVFVTEAAGIADVVHPVPVPLLGVKAAAPLGLLAAAGTYRRSFSWSMRDEWFAVAAALAIVMEPAVILTIVVPGFWASHTAIATFAGIALIGIAASRTLAHRTRAPGRLAVVGVPERIDLALMHLRPRRDDALLRLPVANINPLSRLERSTPTRLQGALTWGATHSA